MLPASMSWARRMTETPVSLSLLRSALSIGVVPRYFGRSEGWMFRIPRGKAAMVSSLMILPKAESTPISGWYLAIISLISALFLV